MPANFWLHRITGGDNAFPLSSELLKKGYLSIGWSYLSNAENLEKMRKSWQSFETLFPECPRNRYNLWRFVNEMSPGDFIVIPQSYTFAICKIADTTVYTAETITSDLLVDWNGKPVTLNKENGHLYDCNNKHIDLGFFRKVEIVETDIPRDKYASPHLYSRMKIRQTNAQINDLSGDVLAALENYRGKKPINLRESILEETVGSVSKKISELLNPDKFEGLVEWYLRSLGARVETPGKSSSPTEAGDADKVGYFDKIGFAIMVQVKKHEGTTGDWAVNQINSYHANNNFGDYSTALWVISSGEKFSEEAIRLAEEYGVKLIDGNTFAKMILEVGLADLSM